MEPEVHLEGGQDLSACLAQKRVGLLPGSALWVGDFER